jgi:hypothetical protein
MQACGYCGHFGFARRNQNIAARLAGNLSRAARLAKPIIIGGVNIYSGKTEKDRRKANADLFS